MGYNINCILSAPTGNKVEEAFTLGQVLGKGAFGVVRLAVDKQTGEQFAIKSISKAKLVCREDIEDVQREVAIMNHVVGHKHIVSVKSTYEDKNYVHIVMDLCEGGELFDSIVEAGSYSEKKAAEVFEKMVRMIQHCHDLGVMHRDLKPENFLLTQKDIKKAEIKATDFGLSMFFKVGDRMRELVGSPYYVAPEVLRKDYSIEADYWSLGVILYILLSGLPPFWGDTEEQIFKMVMKGVVDFDTDPWPRISEQAKDLVGKLLVMDPAKRLDAKGILEHDWMKRETHAQDRPIDNVVMDRMRKFAAMNKMKKTAMMMVGTCLSPEEILGMQQLFKSIDADNNGTITIKELKDAMQKWGHKIGGEELEILMESADVDGDGTINYQEFVGATMNMSKLEQEELIQKAFQKFDSDNSGKITVDELSKALEEFNISEDVDALVKVVDKDGDGQIDYSEFLGMMREKNHDLQQSASQRRGICFFN